MVQRGASTNKHATGREQEPSLLDRLVQRFAFSPQAPRPPTPPSSGYDDTPPPSPSAAVWAAESPRGSPSTVPSPWSAGASSLAVKSGAVSPLSVASLGASPPVAGSPRAASPSVDASPTSAGAASAAGVESPRAASPSSAGAASPPFAGSPRAASPSVVASPTSAGAASAAGVESPRAASPSSAGAVSPAPSSGVASGASPAPLPAAASPSPSVVGSPRAAVDGAASASPSVASSSSDFGPGTMKYVPGVGVVTREEFLAAKTKKRSPSDEDDVVSVSSNESAATRARYKKLGYDSKTVRKPPNPPARHPSSGHKNTYDPDEDTEGVFPVRRLLDRRGKPPKLFYLVEWESVSCKLSWVFESNLVNCDSDKQVVNDYKASRASRLTPSSVSLTKFSKRYREATASVSGLCFFEAIQAAVFMLGRPGILPLRVWEQFEETRGAGSASGVTKSDIGAFFRFLRTVGCPIDIPVIQPNRLNRSTTSLRQLVDYTRGLSEGWYVVHAGEYLEEHCFALRVQAAGAEPIVIDRFVEDEDPPCQVEPVDNLQWIRRVISIRRVQLLPDTWVFRPSKKRRNT